MIVIQEYDESDKDITIIGVAANKDKADKIITEYYGEDNLTLLDFRDVRDSDIECEYTYMVKGLEFICDDCKVTITLLDFELNEI